MCALKDMPDDVLQVEYEGWCDKIKHAKSWGAALATADEFRKQCESELKRRGIFKEPK